METEGTRKAGLSKHTLIMLLCCLVPLAILAVLWVVGLPNSYLVWGVLLLCPLMHVVMMIGSRKKSGDSAGHVH